MADEKKGITVRIDAELHAEVKAFIESQGLTMGEFVAKALDDELHPKISIAGGNTMGKMKTMAFQVPEDLFQKIKDYLNRNHMTQKEFVIGLITKEIDRDLTARQETAQRTVSAEEQQAEEIPEDEENELYGDPDEEFEDYDEDEDEDCYDEEDAEYDEDEEDEYDETEDEDLDTEENDEDEDTAEAEEPLME